MAGFCKSCGKPLKPDGRCPQCTAGSFESVAPRPGFQSKPRARGIGALPKASTPRRLLGSGIEYVVYLILAWTISALNIASAGLLWFLTLIIICLLVLRDFNAGAFNIAKRISHMRVVNLRDGHSASNIQALLRNGYYLFFMLLGTFLPWFDWVFSTLFMMFIVLDVLMILVNPQGRRLGDFLAGTQVIEASI